MTLESDNGLVSGSIASTATPGTYTFGVQVTDRYGQTATQSIAFTLYPPVTITPLAASFPNGEVAVPYSQSVVGAGGDGPLTYSLQSGSLPPGLSLNSSTGQIAGTPTTGSNVGIVSNFQVKVSDTLNFNNFRSYSIRIEGPITFTNSSTTFPSELGVPFSADFIPGGGLQPFVYSITAGSLPPGITLSSGGAFSGTPTATGTFSFTETAVDSVGQSGSKADTITVSANPTIGFNGLVAADVGVPYTATLGASGGIGPFTWALVSGSLPAGITLASNGVVSGTTNAALGTYTFTIQGTDSKGVSTPPTQLTMPVLNGPTFTACTSPTLEVGVSFTAAPICNVQAASPFVAVSFSAGLPPGITQVGPTSNFLQGTPTASGTYTYTMTVTDKWGVTATSPPRTVTVAARLTCGPGTVVLPAAEDGVPYATLVNTGCSGGVGPFGVGLAAGSLPVGLSIDSGGFVNGTPTVLGVSTFTANVSDGRGVTATQQFSITVADTTPPVLTLPPGVSADAAGSAGTAVSYDTSALDSVGGPEAVTCAPASGSVFPVGSTTVNCSASDGSGNTAHGSFTVNVRLRPDHFKIGLAVTGVTTGQTFPVTITALDAADHVLTGYAGPVSLTDTSGSLSVLSISWSGGVATATVFVGVAIARDRVIATDSSFTVPPTGTSTAVFAVTSSTVDYFHLSALPATVSAGDLFTFQVTALDAGSQPITGFTGPLTLTDATGTLNVVSISWSAGVATVTVSVGSAIARDRITVSSGGVSGVTGVFNVLGPVAAFRVSVTLATGEAYGSVTVTAVDSAGQVVTDFAGAVSLSDAVGGLTIYQPGTWTGGVETVGASFSTPTARDRVTVSDGNGHVGISALFIVPVGL
jgi:hypothetical protein